MVSLKVLVTGGAGFIGSHLVDELVRSGFGVTVIDNLSTGREANFSGHLAGRKIRFLRGDVLDRDVVDEAISRDVDVIFHLAAITSVPFSVEYPRITHEVNVDGTRSILEAGLRTGVERFIFVSSCAVYGEPEYLPIDEGHPLKPMSPYAESKLEAEEVCTEYHEAYGLEVTILRPFNVYGPRQRNDQYSGVIAKFIERLREGKSPVIYGDGLQTRDFIHIADTVRAIMLASKTSDAEGGVFNVATGIPTSINELAQLLIDISRSRNIEPKNAAAREGDIRHSYADITKAGKHLGFEPKIPLKEGLANLLGPWRHA